MEAVHHTTEAKAKRVPSDDNISMRDVARELLEDAKGDQVAAQAAMVRMAFAVVRHPSPLLRELVTYAVAELFRSGIRTKRHVIWHGERDTVQPEDHRRRVTALASGNLMMFPLPGGKPLGRALGKEVSAAADTFEAQSADMRIKARWFRLIVKAVGPNQYVSDVLNEKRLEKMKAEAHNG